jgi:putative FmdB family regulatory protein
MPTYEYRCAKCGEHLEVYQSFSETPLTKHKSCGGKLAKVLSPAGIVLKGSGFYKTDARNSSSKGSKSSSSSGESKSTEAKSREGTSSETKSDSSGSGSSGSGSSGSGGGESSAKSA